MRAIYLVTKVEDCPVCEGVGVVQHPAWKEYWKANKSTDEYMTVKKYVNWFREHGWFEKAGYRNEYNSDGIPDEEIVCRECEGERVIESQVELIPLLIELLPVVEQAIEAKVK